MAKTLRPYSTPPIVHLSAQKLKSGAYRYLFGAAGRRWNAMNTERRYELLLQEFQPCEATSKVTLKKWQQLMQGHKVLIVILLQRREANG